MRVLVLSDIHANLAALEAVLVAAPPWDAVWNLGDTVGYGPCPGACIDRLRRLGAEPSLAGNHDLAAIGAIPAEAFNPAARMAITWTAKRLDLDQVDYLARRPPAARAEGTILAHGSPRSPIWEYVTTSEAATENFAFFAGRLCVVGHTHTAGAFSLADGAPVARVSALTPGATIDLSSGRHIVNPGSVGQPRDGDPRAAFGLLDLGSGIYTAHRAAYDIGRTQAKMAAAGLPGPLIHRLALGR